MVRLFMGIVVPALLGLLAAGVVLGMVVPVVRPNIGPATGAVIACVIVAATVGAWQAVARRRHDRSRRR